MYIVPVCASIEPYDKYLRPWHLLKLSNQPECQGRGWENN